MGSIPGSGISSGGRNGNPLQYSCLGNPVVRGAWWATVCGVAKSWMWLSSSCKRPFVLALLPTGEKGGCSVAHMGNGVWEGLHVEEMEQLSFGTLLFPLPSWPFWNLACIAGARSPGTTSLALFAGQLLDSSLPIRDMPERLGGIIKVETTSLASSSCRQFCGLQQTWDFIVASEYFLENHVLWWFRQLWPSLAVFWSFCTFLVF